MGLNNTPMSERVHIGFFGRRNAGKSSVMECRYRQDLAVVSDVKGTTTDPVYKSMELLPITGPVVMIDTPGIDDEGELGKLRVKKSYQTAIRQTRLYLLSMRQRSFREDKKPLKRSRQRKFIIVALNKKKNLQKKRIWNGSRKNLIRMVAGSSK